MRASPARRPGAREPRMHYRRILVAFDGSPQSRLALDECARIVPGSGAEVNVAAVVHDPSVYLLGGEFVPAVPLDRDRERMEADLKEACARLAAQGIAAREHLLVGEPVDVIARLVDELKADLLILGHSRSKKFALRWWRGGVDAILIERVRCSILVAADPTSAA